MVNVQDLLNGGFPFMIKTNKAGFVTIPVRVGQHLAMKDVHIQIGILVVMDNAKHHLQGIILNTNKFFFVMEIARV